MLLNRINKFCVLIEDDIQMSIFLFLFLALVTFFFFFFFFFVLAHAIQHEEMGKD